MASSARHAAVSAFKSDSCPVSLFLMTPSACGLGTDLPRVDVVLLCGVWGVGRGVGTDLPRVDVVLTFNSDWHPLLAVMRSPTPATPVGVALVGRGVDTRLPLAAAWCLTSTGVCLTRTGVSSALRSYT
eukprot:175959-Chlamydomonas_euryale.AAC.1